MRPAIIEHVIVPPRPLDRYKHLQDKGTRTKSYKGWPKSDKMKSELIDDGFFYLGEIDRVQCSFCGGVLHSFKESDNVHIEHYRHFPKCKTFNDTDTEEDAALFRHVLQITNPNQADCSASSDGTSDTELVKQLKNLKLAPNTTCPRHKYYALYKDRLRTFDTWPSNHHLKKEKLADAGLFYAGVDDVCECFCCGGQLEDWEQGDIPLEEHDRWFGDICPMAEQRKMSHGKSRED